MLPLAIDSTATQPQTLIKNAWPPQKLRHEDIAQRIPHQGTMCLLESVTAWDASQIFCEASGHRSSSNPLRGHGRLGGACGIEYAAQAMAIHGALITESQMHVGGQAAAAPKAGYLVSVRSVTLHIDRLDKLDEVLVIHAERMMGDGLTIVYSFTIHAGPALVLSGRATVILEAPEASLAASPSRSQR
jgi:predicted hotdog family 3-hydroxylacyl-ACP dehydratase